MEYDLIYPEDVRSILKAGCIVAAVYFDDDELLSFGVDENSFELKKSIINFVFSSDVFAF